MNLEQKAKNIVMNYMNEKFLLENKPVILNKEAMKLVWFCKTLQNWKALVITQLPDNMFFEITHNGDKNETYLDIYNKIENVCIKPEGTISTKVN